MPRARAVHLPAPGGGARCGNRGAALFGAPGEVTCRQCLGRYSRWADVRPCGTLAAYRRHYRHGEQPCRQCRQADSLRR